MMQTSFAGTMGDWHVQGLYILTPSGKLISGANTVLDVQGTVREMDKGLEKYAKMPREERLLPKAPDPTKDKLVPANPPPRAPTDGLVLRMVSRGLPCEGLSPKDTRHEFFYKLDHVWYTKEEAHAWLPSQLKPGAKEPVKKSLVNILSRLYLGVYIQPNFYWQREDVKEQTLTTEITGIKEDAIEVKFAGHVRSESGGNKRTYEADLLGKATFKPKTQTFSTFELLAVGHHTLGPNEPLDAGQPRTVPLGILFTLNGKNANDQLAPGMYSLYPWMSGD